MGETVFQLYRENVFMNEQSVSQKLWIQTLILQTWHHQEIQRWNLRAQRCYLFLEIVLAMEKQHSITVILTELMLQVFINVHQSFPMRIQYIKAVKNRITCITDMRKIIEQVLNFVPFSCLFFLKQFQISKSLNFRLFWRENSNYFILSLSGK